MRVSRTLLMKLMFDDATMKSNDLKISRRNIFIEIILRIRLCFRKCLKVVFMQIFSIFRQFWENKMSVENDQKGELTSSLILFVKRNCIPLLVTTKFVRKLGFVWSLQCCFYIRHLPSKFSVAYKITTNTHSEE